VRLIDVRAEDLFSDFKVKSSGEVQQEKESKRVPIAKKHKVPRLCICSTSEESAFNKSNEGGCVIELSLPSIEESLV
jgi:hypothetical protein